MRPGIDPERIRSLELEYGVRLPDDAKAVWLWHDGVADQNETLTVRFWGPAPLFPRPGIIATGCARAAHQPKRRRCLPPTGVLLAHPRTPHGLRGHRHHRTPRSRLPRAGLRRHRCDRGVPRHDVVRTNQNVEFCNRRPPLAPRQRSAVEPPPRSCTRVASTRACVTSSTPRRGKDAAENCPHVNSGARLCRIPVTSRSTRNSRCYLAP